MPPRTTAIGALAFYVSHANPHDYQPTNITFGIMEPPPGVIRDKHEAEARASPNARCRSSRGGQRQRLRGRQGQGAEGQRADGVKESFATFCSTCATATSRRTR